MDVSNLPDSDLAVYVRTRDPLEYKEIVRRYSSSIVRYLTVLLGNELTGLEVSEEAFMEAYKSLHSFNPKKSLKVFLYNKAHNESLKYLKKHGKRNLSESEGFEDEFFEIDTTESEFKDPKFVSHVLKYAHKLPVQSRDALVLHILEQFSYDEVSDILEISLLAASNRIDEGRAKIMKYAKEK